MNSESLIIYSSQSITRLLPELNGVTKGAVRLYARLDLMIIIYEDAVVM